MLWILLTACAPEVEVQELNDTADTGRWSIDDDTEDVVDDNGRDKTDETEDTDTDTGPPPGNDQDGDGFTPADGDCNDEDADINPDMLDNGCDGIDNNCDGKKDEGWDEDIYEPNNKRGYDLGDYSDVEFLEGYSFPMGDVDSFEFFIADEWWDNFEISIAIFDVPEQVDAQIELMQMDPESKGWISLDLSDDAGPGGEELVTYEGFPGIDDTGVYKLVVHSATPGTCREAWALEFEHWSL